MDDLSLVIQSIIDTELDDLILDLVYEIHSSIKGIPEEQLELSNNGAKTKAFTVPHSQLQTTAIEKQTCLCPQCGQSNIVAIRFAYHLAKCLGVGRRSSRQAKNRIVDQVMSISTLSDESRSNGDEFQNVESNNAPPEDGGSCTDSTSSSSNNHRRIVNEDQEYTGDFDNEEEDEDDWKPKKKKRRNAPVNVNHANKSKRRRKKDNFGVMTQSISDAAFQNCFIPLDKLSPQRQQRFVSSTAEQVPSNGGNSTVESQEMLVPPSPSSLVPVRSPLNLVEDEESSATAIISFQEDSRQ